MPIAGGRGVNGKIIYIKPDNIEGNDTLLSLTDRHRDILLILSEYLDWKNRWISDEPIFTDDDSRDAYISDLKLRLMQVINFCERMIECITEDPDVKAALLAWLKNELATNEDLQQQVTNITYYNNYTGLPSKPGTTVNILQPANCIKDNAAGFVMTGIVDRAFDNIYQMFDVMILAATDEQKKAAFLDFIPAIGEIADFIAYEDTVTFVGNVTVWIKAQFEAEDSPTLREEYYHDLLCLYMEDCELSIEDIRDYFWQKATKANSGFNNAVDTAVDMYNFLINGTASSFVGIVPVLMGIQFGSAYHIGHLFGMSMERFKILSVLGEPTDDWIAWEALYGECLCRTIWKKPENPIPDLTTEIGLIGVADALAVSEVFIPDDTARIVTEENLTNFEIVDAKEIWVIVDTPNSIHLQLYGDTFFFASDGTGGVTVEFQIYVAPGKWATRFILPSDTSGFIRIWNMGKSTGINTNFKWLEVWVKTSC